MPDSKGIRGLGQIRLVPGEGDDKDEKFQSPQQAMEKLNFRELFTFGTHDRNQPILDHEYTINNLVGNYAVPAMSKSDPSESRAVQENSYKRILAIPGEPPYVSSSIFHKLDKLDLLKFDIPPHHRVQNLRFACEDLCRAAEETKNLDDIRSASFVTDVETLSAMFMTIHDQVVRKEYDKNLEGMCFNIHSENGITFMKTLNSSQFYGRFRLAADNHLKTRVVHRPLLIAKELGNPTKLHDFKRVVSYQFGDYSLVVEDPNQITHSFPRDPTFYRNDDWLRDKLSEFYQFENDRGQYARPYQEDLRVDVPSYDVFNSWRSDGDSPLISSQKQGLYTHITYRSEDDDMMRSQLWFSDTTDFLIGSLWNPDFKAEFPKSDWIMRDLCTMYGWPAFDEWLSDRRVEFSMKLLHRILAHVKHITNALGQQGIKKFYLKQVRRSDPCLVVSLGEEHGYMPQDLVSSYIATELGKARET
ncbi:hypothetical protein F5B19DRAFT_109391 [Rostrohypoxylon terebratum]|nr:hypothetical protein F5B19DRAFT_109391 [Rostrohypoxylon terebratum]